jgi:leucyl aminopeptidase
MLTIFSKKISDAKANSQALVLFAHKSGASWSIPGISKRDTEFVGDVLGQEIEFSDLKKGIFLRRHSLLNHEHIIVVGLDGDDLESLRRASAVAFSSAQANRLQSVSFLLESAGKVTRNLEAAAQAAAEGVLLTDYKYDEFLTSGKNSKKKQTKVGSINLLLSGKMNPAAAEKGVKIAKVICECVNFSRRLGDAPGNIVTPITLAQETQKAARGTGLRVTVWDKARIKRERFGGLYGVNLGGGPDCRFIIMEYNGAGKGKRPVAFVGKGLTFDSGGISIKPSAGMEEMKYDMCGGANVIGTMLSIARLKLKVNAIGLVPTTENMSGPMANKPGDILIARNGKTVEVFNTDAEGRLILMDALSYATEKKPSAIFDAATLTGAVVVALGNSYTGVFTRDQKLMKEIQDAADTAGEPVWHMPINDHHLSDMKGTHADLCNISSFKGAGSSTAAAFLEQFVDSDIPWAHFDIAGTAWNIGNRVNYCPKKGASGVMIRTFIELAKKYGA